MGYRCCLHFSGHDLQKDVTPKLPDNWSLSDIGGKMSRLLDICLHHIPEAYRNLTTADIPDVLPEDRLRTAIEYDQNGQPLPLPTKSQIANLYSHRRDAMSSDSTSAAVTTPPLPTVNLTDGDQELDIHHPLFNVNRSRPVKILILLQFAMYSHIIEEVNSSCSVQIKMGLTCVLQVFASHGIHIRILDGSLPLATRIQILREFAADGPHPAGDGIYFCFILGITPFGHTGLTIIRAQIGILYASIAYTSFHMLVSFADM